MKRMIAVVLCAAVLAVGAWAGLRAWERAQERDAAREKLYAAFEEYIAFHDEIDGIQLWMLGYLEQYLEDGSWESLQRLQAAVSAADEALRSVDGVQFNADRRTKEALSGNSDELILVTENISAAPYELEEARSLVQDVSMFAQTLYTYTIEHAVMEKTADYYGRRIRLEMEYLSRLTNKLLLDWHMKDRWDVLRERYPVFDASSGEWLGEDKRLERLAEGARDELEEIYYSYKSVDQYETELLDIINRGAKSGQYDELRQIIVMPKDAPALFVWPTWGAEVSTVYYDGSGDDARRIRAGDELTQPPTVCVMTWTRVTKEAFETYQAQIQDLGFEATVQENEDGTRTMQVTDGTYSMTLHWSEAETTLTLSEPMPCLVAMLGYLVLTQQL